MAEAGGPSLLDLAPPSGHGDVFHMITGNLRLQDLQVSFLQPAPQTNSRPDCSIACAGLAPVLQAPAYCYHRFTSEDLEVGR